MEGQVMEIGRYAVKSMLGESLAECSIEAQGLAGDRVYALADVATSKIVSAKQPRLWAGLLAMRARFTGEPGAGRPIVVELADGRSVRSDQPDFDELVSAASGRSVRLLAQPPEGSAYDDEWPAIEGLAPESFVEATKTSSSKEGLAVSTLPVGLMAPGTFQDVAPVTILTTASLRMAARLAPDSSWDPRRFRANLLLDADGEGFAENEWVGRRLTIGQTVLQVTAPTPRCVMTTLAQQGLPADRDILRTVAAHNRVDVAGTGVFACLGAYASVVTPGQVRSGDRYRID